MAVSEPYRAPGTLQDVYCAVRRHKWKVLCCIAAAVVAAVAANLLLPASYRSESKLFLRLGRENVLLDPTATMTEKPVIVAPNSREDELNSVVENLTSRQLVEKVVDALGADAILEEATATSGEAVRPNVFRTLKQWLGRLAGGTADTTPRDLAILQMEKRLDVSPVRKSNVVAVAYEAGSPALARDVLGKLVDFYVEEHVRLNRPAGANKFFAEQTEQARLALIQKEEELLALKQKTDMASPDEQAKQLVARRSFLESEYLTAVRDLAAAEAKVKSAEEQLRKLPKNQVAAQLTGQADEGTSKMRDRFYALQMAENDAAAVYTPEHPKWARIHEQVEAARETLDQEERTTTQVTTTVNPAYEGIRLALLREQSAVASIRARVQSLERQLADLKEKSKTFDGDSVRVARLQREVELLDGSYRQYAMNLEKTRVDEALEASRISNICVAQPATYNPRPTRPQKLMNLLLGLMVGVCGGVGIALLTEYFDRSIRRPEDIEAKLRIPTLASIPNLRRGKLHVKVRS